MKNIEVILNDIKRKFESRKFLKSILLISGGTTLAQGLNILFSPIITRIYLPEEYGLMSILTSVLMILSFPSLMYEMAIPIPKKDEEAINVTMLSFNILIIFVILLTITLYLSGSWILDFFNARKLAPYKYYISVGVFMIGLYNILIHWMYRRKNFLLISKTQLGQSITGNITKIGLGYLGLGVSGLLIGAIVKQSAGIISLAKDLITKERYLFTNINLNNMFWSMKKYRNFPIYQTPTMIFLRIKNNLPILSLTFYGAQTVGWYSFANTIVKLPMMLVGHSVTKAFYAEAASIGKENPRKLLSLSNKLFKTMAILGLLPLLILAIWGPHIVSVIFGQNWYDSGVFIRILTISIYADFIFSPASRVYEVIERQKGKMIIDFVALILIIIVFVITRYLNTSSYIAIFLYSISMAMTHLVTFTYANRFLKKEVDKIR
ncbi:lipopolysaccharide biosynthesis protein [Alkalibacterium sp. s-m-22]